MNLSIQNTLIFILFISLNLIYENSFSQKYDKDVLSNISKLREDIKLSIQNGNIQNSKVDIEFEGYSILRIEEKEIYYLLSNNYSVLSENLYYQNENGSYYYEYTEVIYDDLRTVMLQYLKVNEKSIKEKLKESDLDEEKKSTINLFLAYTLFNNNICDKKYESDAQSLKLNHINKFGDQLLQANKRIFNQIEKVTGNWGTGGYFTTGAIITTGNISNYVSNAIPFNLGLTLNYKKYYLFAGYGFSTSSKIKNEFYYKQVWRKNDDIHFFQGEILIGYNFYDSDFLGLTPFIGIGGAGLNPTSSTNNSSYNYNGTPNITPNNNLIYGINFDIRWNNSNCKYLTNTQSFSKKEPYYLITRFAVGINHAGYDQTAEELSGTMIFIKVGIAYQYLLKKRKFWKNKKTEKYSSFEY